MAKVSIDDPNVYYAQMAVSDTSFTSQPFNPATGSGYDPTSDTIQNLTPNPDSYCIAKSGDRGITFPRVACIRIAPNGFGVDGTALAAAASAAGVQEVYLSFNSGNDFPVWRMNGDTLAFTELPHVPPPPGAGGLRLHPRLRVLNGFLYLVAVDTANRVFGARLDARNSAMTWEAPVVLATGVATENGWGGARAVSFDVGGDGSGNTRFRIMYIVDDGITGSALVTRDCNLDLSNCHDLPWNTRGTAGNESQPSLRSGGGNLWVATWMGQPGGLGGLQVVGAHLRSLLIPPTDNDLETIVLSPAVVPCSFTGSGYWGDYNEIDTFGDSRFFAAYTVNGPGCRYRGPMISDQHVGASVFRF